MKISLLIPVYNQEQLILKCLDSIPSDKNIEIIVVDDCSTDKTGLVLESRKDIKYFRNSKNLGIGLTRNILLEKATGDYIFFLDSDDYLYTEEFKKVLNNLSDYDIIENIHENNNGHKGYCHVYRGTFIKSSIAKSIKFKDMRCHEDTYWKKDINDTYKNLKILKSDICLYHYNNPREGSLSATESHKKISVVDGMNWNV